MAMKKSRDKLAQPPTLLEGNFLWKYNVEDPHAELSYEMAAQAMTEFMRNRDAAKVSGKKPPQKQHSMQQEASAKNKVKIRSLQKQLEVGKRKIRYHQVPHYYVFREHPYLVLLGVLHHKKKHFYFVQLSSTEEVNRLCDCIDNHKLVLESQASLDVGGSVTANSGNNRSVSIESGDPATNDNHDLEYDINNPQSKDIEDDTFVIHVNTQEESAPPTTNTINNEMSARQESVISATNANSAALHYQPPYRYSTASSGNGFENQQHVTAASDLRKISSGYGPDAESIKDKLFISRQPAWMQERNNLKADDWDEGIMFMGDQERDEDPVVDYSNTYLYCARAKHPNPPPPSSHSRTSSAAAADYRYEAQFQPQTQQMNYAAAPPAFPTNSYEASAPPAAPDNVGRVSISMADYPIN